MSGFVQPPVTAGAMASPPAVPASTTPVTNTSGRAAFVTVSGGTVTAIAVAGTTVGLIAGTFIVLAGQTITLTYGVAPTWTWAVIS